MVCVQVSFSDCENHVLGSACILVLPMWWLCAVFNSATTLSVCLCYFLRQMSQHCRDTTKSDRRTPFPEAHITNVRFCYSFGDPVCCDAFVSPMAWNCGRLATATSIFCSIADAFVTRCRLFVIRHNDASNFANWCSWSFCLRRRGVGDNQRFDFVGKAQKG